VQRRERLKRERKAGKRTTAGAALSADAEAAEQEAERAWQAEEEAAAEQARHDELQKLQASSRLLRIRFWPFVRPWPHARAFAKRSLRIAERPCLLPAGLLRCIGPSSVSAPAVVYCNQYADSGAPMKLWGRNEIKERCLAMKPAHGALSGDKGRHIGPASSISHSAVPHSPSHGGGTVGVLHGARFLLHVAFYLLHVVCCILHCRPSRRRWRRRAYRSLRLA
jgi:hypothetical protein